MTILVAIYSQFGGWCIPGPQMERLRREFMVAVQDRPADLDVDPVGPVDPGVRELMRRVKERFDPAGVCV